MMKGSQDSLVNSRRTLHFKASSMSNTEQDDNCQNNRDEDESWEEELESDVGVWYGAGAFIVGLKFRSSVKHSTNRG